MKNLCWIMILVALFACQYSQSTSSCQNFLNSGPSIYSCTSCLSDSNLYLFSCQPKTQPITAVSNSMNIIFYIFSSICIALMFFLICMGYGTYRQSFENLQLIAILTWGFNTQYGGQPLMILNWCWVKQGMIGTPMILFLIVFAASLIYLIIGLFTYNRLASDQISMLIKRKRNVFLFRMFHLTFNGLLFASMYELQKAIYVRNINAFPFACGVIYLLYLTVSFVGHTTLINQMKSIDDPYTKVYIQDQTSKQCFNRNHIIISFLVRIFIITFFVFLWSSPTTVVIACTIVQSLYSFYFLFAAKYKKKRYTFVNSISNIFVAIQIIIAGLAAINLSQMQMNTFANLQIVWMSISLFCLVVFVGVLGAQMVANWMKIKRQLRSIFYRYIICTEEEQDVVLNVYDEAYQKSRVSNFKANPLYDMKIELSHIADAI